MPSYIVFLAAPSARQLKNLPDAKFEWKVASSLGKRPRTGDADLDENLVDQPSALKLTRHETEDDGSELPSGYRTSDANVDVEVDARKITKETSRPPTPSDEEDIVQRQSVSGDIPRILSKELLSAAHDRLSQLYKDAVSMNEDGYEDGWGADESDGMRDWDSDTRLSDADGTVFSWPPTQPPACNTAPVEKSLVSGPSRNLTTFLTTQDTNMTSYMQSCMLNSTSSIALLPDFRINLHDLSSLSSLVGSPCSGSVKWSKKTNILVAVLEIEGPELIRIKNGKDAGKDVSILKMVVGEPSIGSDGGNNTSAPFCRLTAWRETADTWAGEDTSRGANVAVKKGDVVYIENVLFSASPQTADTTGIQQNAIYTLTASPWLDSRILICYRILPTDRTDRALCPDLRLGASDAAVRRVDNVVRWLKAVLGV